METQTEKRSPEPKTGRPIKRRIAVLIAASALLFPADLCAQERTSRVELSVGADLVSTYVWRGLFESGPALQPVLTLTVGISRRRHGARSTSTTVIRRWTSR